MSRVFISTCDASSSETMQLIRALETRGMSIVHSPDPGGNDPRWKGWYAQGLEAALKESSAFVAVIDAVWDSSTWMAAESDAALQRYAKQELRFFGHYNPASQVVLAKGMKPYLLNRLPDDPSEAASAVCSALGSPLA